MKTGNFILFGTANLTAVVVIALTVEHVNKEKNFNGIDMANCQVSFTVPIQMPDFYYHLAGRALKGHLIEELTGFRNQFYIHYDNRVFTKNPTP